MAVIVLTGCSSGLGLAIGRALWEAGHKVYGIDQDLNGSQMFPVFQADLTDEIQIRTVTELISSTAREVDVLINCAGVNEISFLEDLRPATWEWLQAINVRAPWLLAQAFLPALKESKGTILNIISNASHMPMTASLAYNASKGALHIMTLQMARELTRLHGITVFGISPNKLKGTGMSKYIEQRVCETRGWSPEYAAQYQKQALITGEETDPERLAEFIDFLLSNKERHKYLAGCIIPYGA